MNLKSIALIKENDRKYLRYQLEYSLEGKDKLHNLKTLLRFKGNPKHLASKLASLPSIINKTQLG